VPRSHTPPEPPQFFADRSLGRHLLPDALRAEGHVAHTLASVYGEQRAQQVTAGPRGDEQVERFLVNINRIAQRSRKPGPWICGVYEDRIAQIWAPPNDGRA